MPTPHRFRWLLALHLGVVLATCAIGLAVRPLVAGRWIGGADATTLAATLRELDTRILLGCGVALCLATALGLVLQGRASAPLPAEAPLSAAATGLARELGPLDVERPSEGAHDAPPEPALEEVARLRRRLARTERIAARREVARQVAHEIKNPLAPIQASIETLRRLKERGSPEFEGYFDEATRTVLAEVRRITTIVGEFSSFARMPPPRFERVRLDEVLHNVAVLHDAPHVTGGDRVRLELRARPTLFADADQLTQVFTNLVKNGIEAARGAGHAPSITLEVELSSPEEVRVLVRDNGTGIEPSIREHLFEPSFSTKRDGSGLGLALVQTIVHEHGGEARLREEGPLGSTFEVTLPLAGPPLAERPSTDTVDPDAP
ncbi:MAG: GHKL domain-containing protein [Deltaproteobacteria bacterium]|nr:GHKL domain-containing protein [Deltaproteobacteria bacterium]